jgi:hypothetical protein
VQQRLEESLSGDVRDRDLNDQQGDGDRKDAVAERLEAAFRSDLWL